jgi:hypothetical protein
VNKPKAAGTAWESWIVKHFVSRGIHAERIAEGGSLDLGDVRIVMGSGQVVIVEAKATQTLNVTRVLSKARIKSKQGRLTVLMWKRLVKLQPGKQRRVPDGEPVVVVMGLDTFDMLMDHWNKDRSVKFN